MYRQAEKVFLTQRGHLPQIMKQDSFLYGGPDLENPEEYSIRLYTPTGEPIKDVWAGGDKGYTELGVVEDAEAEYWSMIDNKKTQFKEMHDKWSAFPT